MPHPLTTTARNAHTRPRRSEAPARKAKATIRKMILVPKQSSVKQRANGYTTSASTVVRRPASLRSASDAAPRSRATRPAVALVEVPRIAEYLLHRVSRGEAEAIRECIARFGGLIWTLSRRVGLPDNEAEDAVHEIFTELWRHGGKYDPGIASETAFVATIARRRLIDRRRKVGRQPVKQQLLEDASPSQGSPATDRTFVAEEAVRAERALEQLSAEQQRVLRLSVYEGLSHELIARSTGLPLGTVKTHARRGLIRLREMLGVEAPATSTAGDGEGGAK
jgi:RNA polymerase sigma factor (sigma-70 family)